MANLGQIFWPVLTPVLCGCPSRDQFCPLFGQPSPAPPSHPTTHPTSRSLLILAPLNHSRHTYTQANPNNHPAPYLDFSVSAIWSAGFEYWPQVGILVQVGCGSPGNRNPNFHELGKYE